MNRKYYLCHYVRREDIGDLLWGYNWRKAIWVDDGTPVPRGLTRYSFYENNMFDKNTGVNVGDTQNFCIDKHCDHEDCGPMTLLYEE